MRRWYQSPRVNNRDPLAVRSLPQRSLSMDASSFDRLARTLATPAPRRRLLGLLGALPLAGSLAALGDEGNEVAAGRKKKRNKCESVICDTCKICKKRKGRCVADAKQDGQACGTSTHGGTALHCCHGNCPDPDCIPLGQPCGSSWSECEVTCCTKRALLTSEGVFLCDYGQYGDCGSDGDCFGSNSICQCGFCCLLSGGATTDPQCSNCCSGKCDAGVCT
jgi:hypothetical protein